MASFDVHALVEQCEQQELEVIMRAKISCSYLYKQSSVCDKLLGVNKLKID